MWICFLLGLFNVGNKLLVSLDLFLKVRARIKLGHHPTEVTRTILDQSHPGKQYFTYQTSSNTLCILNGLCLLPLTGLSTFSSVHNLSSEELSQVLELLLSGYWAFECLTVRDYNDMICGICGVAPKLEFAQRYSNNVLELKNVEVKHQSWSAACIHKARPSASPSGFTCLCCDPSVSVGSLPGPSIRSQTKCTWMTSGWPWKPRPSNKPFSPLTFLSPVWMHLSSPPSFLLWWEGPRSSTRRRTRSSHHHHGPRVLKCYSTENQEWQFTVNTRVTSFILALKICTFAFKCTLLQFQCNFVHINADFP